jgi:hypothetical protein
MLQKSHVGGILVAAALIVACSDSNSPKHQSQIRTVNASPNAPSLDFAVDGALIQSNVVYAATPSYSDVIEDSDHATLLNHSSGATLVTQDIHLETNRNYTMIGVGFLASISSVFVEDSQDAPVSGQTKVRFIQTSPSMPTGVDVYLTSATADLATTAPTISNVAFKAVSSYLIVPTGSNYRLRITATGTKSLLLDVPNINLPSGGVRTFLTLDKVGGGTPFQSMTLADLN